LSDSDRKAVAEYFASLDTPYAVTKTLPNATQLARGHQLARQGVEALRVQACNNCHGPEGIGVPHAAPYLAGQSPEYISSAIKSFINGTRKNDPGKLMSSVAERLDDADIAAVAAYFATVGVGSNP
jgi:thiosulfate dehydrogenase